jgi:hypothetical protein
MTLADAGRTVITPQYDQNFDRRVDPAGEQKDAGIPQAIYMENVIPTVNGFQSVGYSVRAPLTSVVAPGDVNVRAAFVVPDTSNEAVVLFRTNGGLYSDVISSSIEASGWVLHAGATVPTGLSHSIAFVRGVNYWCDGTYLYTFTVNPGSKQVTFTDVSGSVTGVTVANIKYICSAYNYLILLMDDGTIHWSSTTTPTDFTVSLVTGAGSEVPSGAQNANFLVSHPAGFYIYCSNSVVFAQYTGNSRYPWKFTPVSNAGGYTDPNTVSGNYSSEIQYGVDLSGKIQLISGNAATLAAPEISSYLERKTVKDVFDYTTNVFSLLGIGLNTPAVSRLTFVLDRYILLSFSVDYFLSELEFDYAFVYDTLLQRYGVLKVRHAFICASSKYILFVPLREGELCYNPSFNLPVSTHTGVLLLGKFQFVRDRFLQLEEINIESVKDVSSGGTQNFSLLLFPSFDGKNFSTPITLTPTITNSLIQAKTHKTAKSHSIMLKGAFDVNTLELHFRVAGER